MVDAFVELHLVNHKVAKLLCSEEDRTLSFSNRVRDILGDNCSIEASPTSIMGFRELKEMGYEDGGKHSAQDALQLLYEEA